MGPLERLFQNWRRYRMHRRINTRVGRYRTFQSNGLLLLFTAWSEANAESGAIERHGRFWRVRGISGLIIGEKPDWLEVF